MRRGKPVTVIGLLALLAIMGTLTAYSVELYEVFCRVTGYGGTTQIADRPAGTIGDREITIRFNADTGPGLKWRFEPAQASLSIRVGQQAMAFYRAESGAARPVVGTATFNVTPSKAGRYFNKIDCFCFTEQTLDPGQVADLPVLFFVDPAIADDPNLDDVTTITLSYTFFEAPGSRADMDRRGSALPGAPAAVPAPTGRKTIN